MLVDRTRELDRLLPVQSRRQRKAPFRIVVSYAHNDAKFMQQLQMHLQILHHQGLIEYWSERRIVPGQEWDTEVRRQIDSSDFIIVLVSTAFLASGYIHNVEMAAAMERHQKGQATVVPIILESCSWQSESWSTLNVLPENGKPVRHFSPQRAAWTNVEEGLRKLIGKDAARRSTERGGYR